MVLTSVRIWLKLSPKYQYNDQNHESAIQLKLPCRHLKNIRVHCFPAVHDVAEGEHKYVILT